MGLYGALIVRSTTAGRAYNSAATAYDAEAVLVLSEIDPAFNAGPASFNLVNYAPKYWLINGKAYPQTTAIPAAAGSRLLLRYLNAGPIHDTMALLGAHQRVIAKDAYPTAFPYDVVAETIPAGATLDAIATIPASLAVGSSLPLYNRQLHLTNGNVAGNGTVAPHFPGGMQTFVTVAAGPPPPTPTPTPIPTPTPSPTPSPTPLPPAVTLYLSTLDNGTIGSLSVSDEDILSYNGSTFAMVFDGSDVGVGGLGSGCLPDRRRRYDPDVLRQRGNDRQPGHGR